MEDFEINPEITEAVEEAQKEIEELEERILHDAYTELERMFVRAIHRGYDYLDVQMDGGGNVDYVAWNEGGEPDYGPFDSPDDRFDLRGVTYEDIRRAHEQHR